MIGEFTFENTKVSYSITGEGPAVVWLHGFMEDKSIWQGQLDAFDGVTTNVCIDLLGHGETGNVITEHIHTMELQAKAVLAILRHLQINTFSIIGHSMGGYVGLCMLKECPEKISHFILLNATARADIEEKKANRQRAIKIVAQQKDNYVRLGVVNLFSKDSRKLYDNEIEKLVSIAQKTTVQGILAALVGMMQRTSKIGVLKNYNGSKLIVAGKSDPVLSLSDSYKEAKLTGADFEQLQGGHMLYIESKNQLNKILKSFLSF